MVSQRWSAGVKHGVSEPFWWHRLTIYRPERVRSEKAFLFIGGGVQYSRYIAENTFKSDILNSAGFARLAASTGAHDR
jgi:PhoPQ-activated pathogenicity-related protein